MFERQENVVDRVIEHLRRPVALDPALDARVMRDIVAHPVTAHQPWVRALPWLAAAATLAAVLIARPWSSRGDQTDDFQFVLLAPRAASVALVGDFNDWDPVRTPMITSRDGAGLWATVVPLPPGRYRYAFLINGREWRADPSAPAALDDEFGTPSSVVTVGGS
jgi:Carbohydrate-binding module 48 (Isoamylase N-terminal domain)